MWDTGAKRNTAVLSPALAGCSQPRGGMRPDQVHPDTAFGPYNEFEGTGKVIADWMTDGRFELDVHGIDIARYYPIQRTPTYIHDRCSCTNCACGMPISSPFIVLN